MRRLECRVLATAFIVILCGMFHILVPDTFVFTVARSGNVMFVPQNGVPAVLFFKKLSRKISTTRKRHAPCVTSVLSAHCFLDLRVDQG